MRLKNVNTLNGYIIRVKNKKCGSMAPCCLVMSKYMIPIN